MKEENERYALHLERQSKECTVYILIQSYREELHMQNRKKKNLLISSVW